MNFAEEDVGGWENWIERQGERKLRSVGPRVSPYFAEPDSDEGDGDETSLPGLIFCARPSFH